MNTSWPEWSVLFLGFFKSSPLFSPKYRVCWAVFDHWREELSFSFTLQVSVTVPPTDTVSSWVTGWKGSSSGQQGEDGWDVIRIRARNSERETRCLRCKLDSSSLSSPSSSSLSVLLCNLHWKNEDGRVISAKSVSSAKGTKEHEVKKRVVSNTNDNKYNTPVTDAHIQYLIYTWNYHPFWVIGSQGDGFETSDINSSVNWARHWKNLFVTTEKLEMEKICNVVFA